MSNIIDQLLKIDANKIEMPKGTHKMYCKKLGQELEFEIEAIDAEKVAEIQEMAIDITKGEINSIDTYKLKVETIACGCKMDSLNEAINKLNAATEIEENEIKN